MQKGTTEVYWYGAGSEILSEAHPAAIDSDYIYFGGKRVAWRRYNEPNVIYYEADMLGSSRTTVIAGQTSPWSEADYYPFGGERAINDSYPPNHFKFEGKQRDTETGNDDFGARYYNSRIGRWLSADWSSVPAPVPYANLTNPQTLNLYAMVSDNPETFADLDGHLLEGTPSGDPAPSGGSSTNGENPTTSGTQNTAGQAASQTESKQQPAACTSTNCFIAPDPTNQTATMTITSTNTTLSTNSNGDTISTTTRTTTTITVSTAEANRGQVLGGTITTQTSIANVSIPGAPLVTTPLTTTQMNPLQATNAVGGQNLSKLESSSQPSFFRKHWAGLIGTAGAACALAEPCGLIGGATAVAGGLLEMANNP